MDSKNKRKSGRDVTELLRPKHLPECDITFDKINKGKHSYWAATLRIVSIAAMLIIIFLVTARTNLISTTQAATSPFKVLYRGLEKMANQKSMCVEFRTKEKIKIGLPVKDDGAATCRLYFLRKDSVTYMREEWDDEYNSVAIYDKDSLRLWQNSQLQRTLEIPFRPARFEYLYDWFSEILSKYSNSLNEVKSGIVPDEDNASAKGFELIEVSKDGKTVTFETKISASQFYILVFSTEREELINVKLVEGEKESDSRKTTMEYSNIVYDYPITLNEMMKAPSRL